MFKIIVAFIRQELVATGLGRDLFSVTRSLAVANIPLDFLRVLVLP